MESQEPIKTWKNTIITVPKRGHTNRKTVSQAKKDKKGTKRKMAEMEGANEDEQEGTLHGGNISVIQGREPKRLQDIMKADANETDFEEEE